MRALSHHFPADSDAAEQLREFAHKLEQRARELDAGRSSQTP